MSKGKTTKENTWQCIEFYIKRYPELSIEECEKIRQEKLLSRKVNNPNHIEYWVKKNPGLSLEECEKLLLKYKRENSYQCIEYWVKKNPELSLEECEKLRKERIKNGINKRPDNSGANNPNSIQNASEEIRKQNSPYSLEFYKKKYPNLTIEEYEKLRNDFVRKRKYIKENHSNTIEYYLSRGFSIEEAILKLSERQKTFTLEKCIKKYGDIDGLEIFNKRNEEWAKKISQNFNNGNSFAQSMFAKQIINELKQIFPEIECEYVISRYSFDCKYKNKLIEINGDYFHCNPQLYEKDFYNKLSKKYAWQIWEKDKRKTQIAINKGYSVFTIWEKDYHENKDLVMKKCIDFLSL